MKKNLLSFVATLLLSGLAIAQTSTIKTPKFEESYTGMAAHGFRVSVFKPNYEFVTDFEAGEVNSGQTSSDSEKFDLDMGNGLSIGYAYIPVQSIGYIAALNYIQLVFDDRSTNTVRLDGNATYAFNKVFYTKLGLNFNKYVGENSAGIDPEFGFQGGVGFQLTRYVGFELTYSRARLSSDAEVNGIVVNVDRTIQGLEMGLTGTF